MAARAIILHVDDDANDILLLQHACRKASAGFDVQAVHDGNEAIAYLQGTATFSDRQKHPLPNLLLLDLKMPRMNGFDVLVWLRQQQDFKRLPVIVLTSSNHDADVRRAYDLGANSYLVKPVGFEGLVGLVKTIQNYWINLNEKPRP
jgi:CheY-like chemotaxis protein